MVSIQKLFSSITIYVCLLRLIGIKDWPTADSKPSRSKLLRKINKNLGNISKY